MRHKTAPTITAPRDPSTGMYLANLNKLTKPLPPISASTHHQSNHVYDMRTKVDLATYLHMCAWSPTPDTWIKSIDKNFFTTWPGLTSQLIRKHLPKSIPTSKGHQKMIRQHIRSTKQKIPAASIHPVTTKMGPSKTHIRTN